VLRTGYADAQFTFEPTSTEQERNDIVGMFASALSAGSTLVNDTVVKLQGVY
jgi:methionine synthase II (cobalamin-independent)